MSEDTLTALAADAVIELLGMKPLVFEGGYFAETHRAGVLARELVPWQPDDHRSLKTAIYYLLTPDTMSAMHLLPGDEIFHHYLGDPGATATALPGRHWPDGSDWQRSVGR